MKAISLWNPWAEAMRRGMKRNETRSWPTLHRGDLVICSAKRPLDQLGLAVAREQNIPLPALKFGFALCVVELHTCTPSDFPLLLSELESALGDYSPRRYVWQTRRLRTLNQPVPVVGRQGLWNLPPETVALINAQLNPEL
jgi:activating signal cointegrator 1